MTGALRRAILLTATCDPACTLRLDATVRPRDGARRPTRSVRRATLHLKAGRATTVVLRLASRDVRVLRRALGRRTALRLHVSARATATGAKAATVQRVLSARA